METINIYKGAEAQKIHDFLFKQGLSGSLYLNELREKTKATKYPGWLVLDIEGKHKEIVVHIFAPIILIRRDNSTSFARRLLSEIKTDESVFSFDGNAQKIFIALGHKFPNKYKNKPPRYIRDYALRGKDIKKMVGEVKKVSNAGEDEQAICYFGVRCKCGSEVFELTGNETGGVEGIVDPVVAKCIGCGTRITLFDQREHGYDASIGELPQMERTLTGKTIGCAKCGHKGMKTALLIENTIDYDEAKNICGEIKGKKKIFPEDLFDWIYIYGQCEKCGTISEITNAECA
jgi:hypothetical protein